MKNELRSTQGEGYILNQGETEIAHFKQSWFAFAKEAIILCIAVVWLIMLLDGFSKQSILDWLQCALLVIIMWYEISSIRRKLWYSLTLTNERIIFQGEAMHPFSGYVFYKYIDKIVDTSYFYEKLFRIGRVYVKSVGKEYTFKNIKEKDKFIQLVQDQVKVAKQ